MPNKSMEGSISNCGSITPVLVSGYNKSRRYFISLCSELMKTRRTFRRGSTLAIMLFSLALQTLAVDIAMADKTFLVFEPAGEANGKHVVLISGDEEYHSEESCPMLAKILSQHHGFKCTVLFAIDKETGCINPFEISNIPGMESLESADVMILATRWRTLPDEQIKHVFNYMQAGKPIIAFRTATHAFKSGNYGGYDWANFGKMVVGENWLSHHGDHKTQGGRAFIVEENKDHPILNSVADIFTPSDIYGIKHLDQSAATMLLRGGVTETLDPASQLVAGPKNDPMMPLAWLKDYDSPDGKTKGKCFATTAGAAVDYRWEDLRRMIVNATLFLADLDVPEKANVDYVDPFEPSFYGFPAKDYYVKRNLRVEDFELGSSGRALPDPRKKKK